MFVNYDMLKEYLSNNQKTWLVTGVAGFIGSNLAEELLKLNQRVISIDNFSTGHKYNLDHIQASVSKNQWSSFDFIEGDISDYNTCLKITDNIDIILNQAALGSVPRSIENPLNSNNSNVTGFINIITAAKENGVKRVVYASSSSVYGDSKELPKKEEVTGSLLSPYAATKLINELYAGVFSKCYDLGIIGLRYFNVFGKRQDPKGAYAAVIPKWINKLLHNETVEVFGDGKTSRDFTYIQNVVQANILAGMSDNKKALGQVFNTAVGGRETLNGLYSLITQALKENIPDIEIKEVIYKEFRAGDIRHSNADISKIMEYLEYQPTHTLEKGLKESIVWYINDLKKDIK